MAYPKAKLKSNGDKETPFFKPFLRGNISGKCFPSQLCYRFISDTFLLALAVSWRYQTQ